MKYTIKNEAAGAEISLSGSSLRTSGVELCGAAKGLTPAVMGESYQQILQWTRSGELTFAVQKVALADISIAWQQTSQKGSRLVVLP